MNKSFFKHLIYKKRIPVKIAHLAVVIVLTVFLSPYIKCQQAATITPFGEGIQAKVFYSSTVDDDGVVWFLTDAGILSFDGAKWTIHNKNRKITAKDMKDVVYDFSSYGPELWIASPLGATVVSTPVDARSGATTYYLDNSKILSENVLAIAAGKKELRWFGTDKGISAFKSRKWLTNNYSRKYPEGIFQDYPITSMATSVDGDSLYVGTMGAGVLRVYRNDVDAVSGASEYAQWGPILMPSDSVYSVYVSPDGTQWFGTNKGIAKHSGYNTLEGWTIYDTNSGLADNLVQAINSDRKGNLYLGTKNGLSVFDGTKWTNYQTANGLVSNNILSIAINKNNVVWLGTDNGVTCIKNGLFISYQQDK
jgi:ligand-binding sensor domain-containing protein